VVEFDQPAVFGDFTAMARAALSRALAVPVDGRVEDGVGAARAQALADLARVLHGYAATYGPTAAQAGVPAHVTAELRAHLAEVNQAAAAAQARATANPDESAFAVADAARMLSLGHDLLLGHRSPTGAPRTPYGPVLDTPRAAAHLVGVAAEAAEDLAELAGRVTLGARDSAAVRHLRRSATELRISAARASVATMGASRTLAAMPTAAVLGPLPVHPREPIPDALQRIVTGCDQLAAAAVREGHSITPVLTPADMAAVSGNLSIGHLLASRLIAHTTADLAAGDGEAAAALRRAGEDLRAAARSWREAARSWGDHLAAIPVDTSGRHAVRTAEGIAVRAGRILYDAEGWTPREGGARPLRPVDQVLADERAVDRLADAMREIASAGETVAQLYPAITARLMDRGLLLSADPAHHPLGADPAAQMRDGWTRWYRAHPEQVAPVIAAFGMAEHASVRAEAATAEAARAIGRPSARAALAFERRNMQPAPPTVTVDQAARAVSIAAAGFPDPPSAALDTTPRAPGSQIRPATQTPDRSRTR